MNGLRPGTPGSGLFTQSFLVSLGHGPPVSDPEACSLEQPGDPLPEATGASICISLGNTTWQRRSMPRQCSLIKMPSPCTPIDNKVGSLGEILVLALRHKALQSSLTMDGGWFLLCGSLQRAHRPLV